jgi:putative ABC transport system permease protein|tara:strand:- start:2183 stop:3418 length:1236 start_codon:yes stop_codon:yes gene_type:complete
MSIFSILKTSLNSLSTNKLRSGLTLLGIVIGILSVISLMGMGKGFEKSVTDTIESLGSNLIYITSSRDSKSGASSIISLKDAEILAEKRENSAIKSVTPELVQMGKINFSNNWKYTQVYGITQNYKTVRNLDMKFGSFISDLHVENMAEVAVLGINAANELLGNRNPVGQYIRINGRSMQVIGVLEEKGGGFGGVSIDDRALIPVTTAHYRLSNSSNTPGTVALASIVVEANSAEEVNKALLEATSVLRFNHKIASDEDDDFEIINQQEVLDTFKTVTQGITIFLGAIAGISLLVGGIGVMNIMLVSVTERTREIGIRKSLGAKRKDILLQFVSESVVLSTIGGMVGIFLGWLSLYFIGQIEIGDDPFRTEFTLDIAMLAFGVSAATGLFFGIFPALRASKLQPVEALRYQ